MSKTKIVLILTATAIVIIPIWMYISFVGSTEALCERFPDIPPDVVYRAHKEIYLETLKGMHNNVDDDADGSTGEFDKIFLTKCKKFMKTWSPYGQDLSAS